MSELFYIVYQTQQYGTVYFMHDRPPKENIYAILLVCQNNKIRISDFKSILLNVVLMSLLTHIIISYIIRVLTQLFVKY